MNTTELIIEVARRTQSTQIRLTRREVQQVIDLMLDVMREELAEPDGEIRLKQFGMLSVFETRMSGGTLQAGSGGHKQQTISAGGTYVRLRFRSSRSLNRILQRTFQEFNS